MSIVIQLKKNNGECDWRFVFAFYPKLGSVAYVAACFMAAHKGGKSPTKPLSLYYFDILDTQMAELVKVTYYFTTYSTF